MLTASPAAPVLDLHRVPDAVALVLADGTELSYAALAARVARRAASWGPARRLVLVEGANDVESLVSYLAALNHGHVALVVPDGRPDQRAALVAAYDPDIVCTTGGDLPGDHPGVLPGDQVRRAETAHDLHPDLALLLSTSGSTGSPKLVRLSRDNVASNAEAIATYLRLTPQDRAITALPLHYCYGLSVLHSHLHAGAGVVLTDLSVVDACFWELFSRAGATTLAGVPFTFELLERSGFADRELPTLRQVTQAGGRLSPERVRSLATLGRERGWDLVVMYGQTEATARMAWLPPELALDHPDAIGVPIPGGSLRLEPVPEAPDEQVGELVYTGPNVMMGYAATPADLSRGAELTELRTGDLARVRDGLFHVVGRRNRHAKVFGLRLDLDRVEEHLEASGHPAHCVATDDQVHVFVPHGRRAARLRDVVGRFCGLPASAVRVHVLAEAPRTPSGKVDRAALLQRAEQARPGADPPASGNPVDRLLAHYALVLGRPDATPADSFVSLGGDSLSYVELATRLERAVPGGLPAGWHTAAISSLAAQADGAADGAADAHPAVRTAVADAPPGRTRRPQRTRRPRPSVDTTIALRAVAIVLIVASHVDLVAMEGGAHLLLALAGFNFARFQLGLSSRSARLRHGFAGLAQLVVPSVLWIGAVGLVAGSYAPATALFLNSALGSDEWTDQWQFWFLEALVWVTVVALAVVAVPALHRAERRHPFGFALALLAGAAAVRFAWVGLSAGPTERYTPGIVAFFFALGWLGARATSVRRRWFVSALAVVLVAGFFHDPAREAVILVGFALMLWVPRLPCPRPVARVAGTLAGASLFIYLTQWQVYPPLEDAGLPVTAMLAAFAVGIGYAQLMRPVQRAIARLFRGPRPPAAATGQVSAPEAVHGRVSADG